MTQPWIQTNFVRGENGNMIPFGAKLLKVKIPGSKWVAGMLLKKNSSGSYYGIQAEQTGGHNNPWDDKIIFEMQQYKNGAIGPMPEGEYKIIVRASRLGIQGFTDEFYIGSK